MGTRMSRPSGHLPFEDSLKRYARANGIETDRTMPEVINASNRRGLLRFEVIVGLHAEGTQRTEWAKIAGCSVIGFVEPS